MRASTDLCAMSHPARAGHVEGRTPPPPSPPRRRRIPLARATLKALRGADPHLAGSEMSIMDLIWLGDEVQIRTFKHVLAWAPELISLAREKTGVVLH